MSHDFKICHELIICFLDVFGRDTPHKIVEAVFKYDAFGDRAVGTPDVSTQPREAVRLKSIRDAVQLAPLFTIDWVGLSRSDEVARAHGVKPD